MSVPFSGRIRPLGSIQSAISCRLKEFTLKPVKTVVFHMDPFHETSVLLRRMMAFLSAPKIRLTNPACVYKTEVVNDRSEATIRAELESGNRVVLQLTLMDEVDVLNAWNKHISSMVDKQQQGSAAKTADGKTVVGKARLRASV